MLKLSTEFKHRNKEKRIINLHLLTHKEHQLRGLILVREIFLYGYLHSFISGAIHRLSSVEC